MSNTTNDEFVEDLQSLLPKANSYDESFLKSHIHLSVPCYYVAITICKILAYIYGDGSLLLSSLELFFVAVISVPMCIRHFMRKSKSGRRVLFAHFPVYYDIGTAVFVSTDFWQGTKENMDCIPELPTFPIFFRGGAPAIFWGGCPILSGLSMLLSYDSRTTTNSLLFCVVWITSTANVIFAFSSAWFPTKHGIKFVCSEIKKLDMNVAAIRNDILAQSFVAGSKWGRYNWENNVLGKSITYPIAGTFLVLVLWLMIIAFSPEYDGERSAHALFGKNGTRFFFSILCCLLERTKQYLLQRFSSLGHASCEAM
jgi:hypothetical protein